MGKKAEQALVLIFTSLLVFFWPLNFLIHNNLKDTIHFFLPSLLLFCAVTLFKDKIVGRNILLACIPILNSSLILVPIISLLYKNKKIGYVLFGIVLSLSVFFVAKSFIGSSIFYYEHHDQQKIIRQGYLYPNIYLSRMFQNKPSIYIDRFLFNFFSLIDPNNYFFGFHPRQIPVENQNLQKFPFLSVIFFLTGLYQAIFKRKLLLISLLIVLINLALLKNFDKTDSLVWLPVSILVIEGVWIYLKKMNFQKWLLIFIFLIFTLVEYFQLIASGLINI
jgi:hypothetical protein